MTNTKFDAILYFFLAISLGALLFLNRDTKNRIVETNKTNLIEEKMMDYDRCFLPYLYYATIEDSLGVSQTIDAVADAWYILEDELGSVNQVSDRNENLFLAKQWLFESFVSTDDFMHQFVSIDLTRFYLMEIRRELELDYYLDYLWKFEASLDLVYEPANDPMFKSR